MICSSCQQRVHTISTCPCSLVAPDCVVKFPLGLGFFPVWHMAQTLSQLTWSVAPFFFFFGGCLNMVFSFFGGCPTLKIRPSPPKRAATELGSGPGLAAGLPKVKLSAIRIRSPSQGLQLCLWLVGKEFAFFLLIIRGFPGIKAPNMLVVGKQQQKTCLAYCGLVVEIQPLNC